MQGRRDTTHTTRTPYLAALGVSLGCHAAVFGVLALMPRAPRLDPPPIVVAILSDGGATGERGASGATAGADDATPARAEHRAADAAEPPARVVAAAPARFDPPAPSRRPERHAARRRDPAVDVGHAPARSAAEKTAAAADVEDAAASGAAASGDAGANPAAGRGANGSGRGTGASGAGDGGDLRAWCAQCPTPEYPARARRQGWQGTVDVELHVGRDGAVEQASIGRSSGFAVLDAAAVTVARRSRFRVAVGTDLHGQLRYRFVLEEAQDRPL